LKTELEDGVIPLGRSRIIHDTPTVKELLERLILEAATAHQKAAMKLAE